MKKNNYFILMSGMFLMIIMMGCFGGGNKNEEDISRFTSLELEQMGWQMFKEGRFLDAEKYFEELTKREEHFYLVGHGGLGWTFLKTYKYQNSRLEFQKFFVLDTLNLYAPADSLTRDVRAGQVLVNSALSEHVDLIAASSVFTASNNTNNNWKFRYDNTIDVIDMRLLRAASQVALKNFTDAYAMVRLIEPSFETNINTVEGRLLLVQKIEEMIFDRS